MVLYEAPHRLLETLGDLSSAGCGDRGILLARELTKLHEELHRGSVHSAYLWHSSVAEKEGRIRGEFTVVLAPLDAAVGRAAEGGPHGREAGGGRGRVGKARGGRRDLKGVQGGGGRVWRGEEGGLRGVPALEVGA